jgi:hypothetical protein
MTSPLTHDQINSCQELDFETAIIEADKLENANRQEAGGCTVYTGRHPEHGDIHIIIPPLGGGLLLFPFVSRIF